MSSSKNTIPTSPPLQAKLLPVGVFGASDGAALVHGVVYKQLLLTLSTWSTQDVQRRHLHSCGISGDLWHAAFFKCLQQNTWDGSAYTKVCAQSAAMDPAQGSAAPEGCGPKAEEPQSQGILLSASTLNEYSRIA